MGFKINLNNFWQGIPLIVILFFMVFFRKLNEIENDKLGTAFAFNN